MESPPAPYENKIFFANLKIFFLEKKLSRRKFLGSVFCDISFEKSFAGHVQGRRTLFH